MFHFFPTVPGWMALLCRPALVLVVEGLADLLLAGTGVAAAIRGGADSRIQVGEWLLLHPRPQPVSEHDHFLLTVEDVEIAVSAPASVDVVLQPYFIARKAGGKGDVKLQGSGL